jgi:hypothetical protein
MLWLVDDSYVDGELNMLTMSLCDLFCMIYIYIYICYTSPRVMDPLVQHLDPKVKPTDELTDRPKHPDSQKRPPAPSPARACLPRGPCPASHARARSPVRVPPLQYRHASPTRAARPAPCALTHSAPAHVAQPFFEISPRAQPFLL